MLFHVVPLIHKNQSKFDIYLLFSDHWEIFPHHKNRNLYIYSIFYILIHITFSILSFRKQNQLMADETDSILTVRNGPWPAVMSIPKKIIGLMAVILRRNDIDRVFICGHEMFQLAVPLTITHQICQQSIPLYRSRTTETMLNTSKILDLNRVSCYFTLLCSW